MWEGMKKVAEKVAACYQSAYGAEPFVRLLEGRGSGHQKMCRDKRDRNCWRLESANRRSL